MIQLDGTVFTPIFIGLFFLIVLDRQPYTPLMWVVRSIAALLILLGIFRYIRNNRPPKND